MVLRHLVIGLACLCCFSPLCASANSEEQTRFIVQISPLEPKGEAQGTLCLYDKPCFIDVYESRSGDPVLTAEVLFHEGQAVVKFRARARRLYIDGEPYLVIPLGRDARAQRTATVKVPPPLANFSYGLNSLVAQDTNAAVAKLQITILPSQ